MIVFQIHTIRDAVNNVALVSQKWQFKPCCATLRLFDYSYRSLKVKRFQWRFALTKPCQMTLNNLIVAIVEGGSMFHISGFCLIPEVLNTYG